MTALDGVRDDSEHRRGDPPERRDPFAVDEESALHELRLEWGDAYACGHDGGTWKAVSRDQERRTLTADTPDELTVKMRADWAREGTL